MDKLPFILDSFINKEKINTHVEHKRATPTPQSIELDNKFHQVKLLTIQQMINSMDPKTHYSYQLTHSHSTFHKTLRKYQFTAYNIKPAASFH